MAVVARARAGRGRAGAAAGAPSGHRHAGVQLLGELPKATERFKRDFGDDAVVVLVKGDLQRTMLSPDLGRLIRLEGCLSGNVPEEGLRTLPDGCRELARAQASEGGVRPRHVHQHRRQPDHRASSRAAPRKQASRRRAGGDRRPQALGQRGATREARAGAAGAAARASSSRASSRRDRSQLALRYGITGLPTIDNPDFVSTLVFDPAGREASAMPKSRFAYLFPSPNAALVQVRLRPA